MTNGRWSATPWKVIPYPYASNRYVLADRSGKMLPVSVGDFSDLEDALNHAPRPLFRLGRILYLRFWTQGLPPDTKIRTVCYPAWSAEIGEWTYLVVADPTRESFVTKESNLKERRNY